MGIYHLQIHVNKDTNIRTVHGLVRVGFGLSNKLEFTENL